MSDTKILQMILDRIISLEKKVGNGNKELKEEIIKNRKRIDKFGIQLAELSQETGKSIPSLQGWKESNFRYRFWRPTSYH